MDTILDAHCHLADPRLYPDLDGALARAADAAVGTIVAVGAIDTIETDRLTVEIAERHPRVFAGSAGCHSGLINDVDESRVVYAPQDIDDLLVVDEWLRAVLARVVEFGADVSSQRSGLANA